MERSAKPLPHDEALLRIIEMLRAHGLRVFEASYYDADEDELVVIWDHGLAVHFDLRGGVIEPLDEADREAIRGESLGCECPPMDVVVAGSPTDPRDEQPVPGVRVHHVPELHPDDVTVFEGLTVTTPSRTLIDLAEVMNRDELRDTFRRAHDRGLLDPGALQASRARVEWRPSLAMLDEVIAEFCG